MRSSLARTLAGAMSSPSRVLHFSDALCVWAYVAQIRIEELQSEFGDQIRVDFRFLDVFGSAQRKLERSWGDRGGFAAYGAHVRQVAADFPHVTVHPEIWTRDVPTSSTPAHLLLAAIRELEAESAVETGATAHTASAIRRAFFEHRVDISDRTALLAIAEDQDLPIAVLERRLDSGAAHAQLSDDRAEASAHQVTMSPTLVFDEGRQKLAGNVGYRVISANVRELLTQPAAQASWC